jgi:hypothetical protein
VIHPPQVAAIVLKKLLDASKEEGSLFEVRVGSGRCMAAAQHTC